MANILSLGAAGTKSPAPLQAAKPTTKSAPKAPAATVRPGSGVAVAIGQQPKPTGLFDKRGVVDGAATAPVTPAGSFVASGGRVSVDILASDSGYDNQIYWSNDNFKTRHLIGTDNRTATVDLGEFAAGTQIQLGIANGAGQFFRSGGADANADGFDHVRTSVGPNGLTIGFEDLQNGGDQDFNDAIVQVRGLSVASQGTKQGDKFPVPPIPAAPAPAPPNPTAPKPSLPTPAPVTPLPVVKKPLAPKRVAPTPSLPTPAPVAPRPNEPKPTAPKPILPTPAPTAPKPSLPQPAPGSTGKAGNDGNRSGLGDGTNPGHGAGADRSPNIGTLNPGQPSKPAAVRTHASQAVGSFYGALTTPAAAPMLRVSA